MTLLLRRAALLAVIFADVAAAQENLFLPTPSSVPSPMGVVGSRSRAYGDLNGDGRVDVVLTDDGGSTAILSTHLGDGFGRFGPAIASISHPSGEAAIADFDADGDTDVVVMDPNSMNALVYFGNGTGALELSIVVSLSHLSSVLRVADLDVDGDPDFVTAGIQFGNIAKWDIASNTGVGFVATTKPLSVPGPIPATFVVEVATLNGDAFPDVIVGPSAGSLELWLGGAGGVFTPGTPLPFANDVRAVIASDLDGDGDRDVLIGDATTSVSVLANSGAGTFAPAATLLPLAPTAEPHLYAIDDVDRDGDDDVLVYSTLGVAYSRNDGALSFTDFAPTPSAAAKLEVEALIDLNGDRRSDLLAYSPHSASIVAAIAIGPVLYDLPPPSQPASPYTPYARVADVDLDGDLDYLGSSPSTGAFTTYANDGAGAFASIASTTLPSTQFDVGDIDGDGDPDLAFIEVPATIGFMRWRAGDGTGAFAPAVAASVGLGAGTFSGFVCGDVDGDGMTECAYGISPASRVGVVWLGAGSPPPMMSWAAFPTPINPSHILLHDLIGDARLELIAPVKNAAGVHVFSQNGGHSFSTTSQIIALSASPSSIRAGDVNGDAVTDIVGYAKVVLDAQISTALGLGSGAFASPTALHLGKHGFVPSIVVADVDGDGIDDATIASNGPHVVSIAFGRVGEGLTEPIVHDVGSAPYAVDVGSFDGDPQNELIAMRLGDSAPILLQPRCRGGAAPIGHACVGAGGFAPGFSLVGCVEGGSTVTLGVHDALGGSVALVVFALAPAITPFATTCALQVSAVLPAQIVLALPGTGPGNGELAVTLGVPATAPVGTFAMQAFVADPTLPAGYTTTQALEVVVR